MCEAQDEKMLQVELERSQEKNRKILELQRQRMEHAKIRQKILK